LKKKNCRKIQTVKSILKIIILSKVCRAVACRIPNILDDMALENMKKTSEDFKSKHGDKHGGLMKYIRYFT
jgi:hypothetical protein